MDEASSKFVDQLVTQKLVSEKLAKVSHRPACPLETLLDVPFSGFTLPFGTTDVLEDVAGKTITIRSAIDCTYEENRWARIVVHEAERPRGAVLLVHGLFEDNRQIYGFLIGEFLRLGYSIYQTTLPFHYERRPASSLFGGEFFLSAELRRTKGAFRQATLELQQCYDLLSQRLDVPLSVVGFSMGGAVALTAAGLTERLNRVCLINPATRLTELVWTSPLCQTIKNDLLSAGCDAKLIDSVLETFDPFSLQANALNRQRVLMIYGQYDQVTLSKQYEEMIRHFNLPNVLRYKAGHLNTLRVPRLAEDIVKFLESTNGGGVFDVENLL
jgi:pimeloyl-ACP methyl ester carboxylesterase